MAKPPSRSSETQLDFPAGFWGRLSGFTLVVVLAGLILDQVSKVWLLYEFGLAQRSPVEVLPVLESDACVEPGHLLRAIFQQDGEFGRWLLAAFHLGREYRPFGSGRFALNAASSP